MDSFEPLKWEAEIIFDEPTEELQKEMASIVEFPKNKTPDLLFFHGLMVSTGSNLNNAHFLGSEIVAADHTIDLKALDIEHAESDVIGFIYSHKLIARDGTALDVEELKKLSKEELDSIPFDVHIAGIVYKSRFSELAKEIEDNKWKLSMETYYTDFSIKVGDLIMSRREAELIGLASDEVVGKVARVLRNSVEVANDKIVRVLHGLMFSGCGVVKNPAEPRALIFEVAKDKCDATQLQVEILDKFIETSAEVENMEDVEIKTDAPKEKSDLDSIDVRQQTSVGICVSYKKYMYDKEPAGVDSKIIHNDWCALYDVACTSSSRGADDAACLRNKIEDKARLCLHEFMNAGKRNKLLKDLKALLSQSSKK